MTARQFLAGAAQRIVLFVAIADHDQLAGLGPQDGRVGKRRCADKAAHDSST